MHMLKALMLLIVAALPATSLPAASSGPPTRVEVVATGLDHPWSIAFLPDGSALVTERPGRLKHILNGKVTAISGVPRPFAEGQAGLFDVRIHPGFEANGLIFLSYAHGTARANATRVARARLVGNRLESVTTIFTASPMKRGPAHFGGRMAFLPDGTLLLTTGDGFDLREEAQRKASALGKTLRFTIDGRIPADNPFAGRTDALGAVWTLGHRNPQGLAHDPVRGVVFQHEHGPRGGDEVNLLLAGRNYGWPVATFGRDYSGATISPYSRYRGTEAPLLHWTPSIAPSGLAVYRGAMFPEWQGDLLVGALVDREVRRVHLSAEGRVLGQESLFADLGERIRDVAVAPDGAIWLATDSASGRLIRISRQP
ncbi:PQQ-dependent sugar dehydrogenase [Sandaracinobacteroides sp. A072]|uniref:PQQ-dependent sugar dehydrogenase n=1 Tax=Sandaracinobacteroides sp. A072 TaxID=3461146 RepID=UPI004040FDDC